MSDEKKDVEERTILQKKADAYLVLQERVHVKFISGIWKRGLIKEVKADFFILDDTLEGIMPIFFQETKDIEKYRKESIT